MATPGDLYSVERVLLQIRFEPGSSVQRMVRVRSGAEPAGRELAGMGLGGILAGLAILLGLLSLGIFLFWLYLSSLLSQRPVDQTLSGFS